MSTSFLRCSLCGEIYPLGTAVGAAHTCRNTTYTFPHTGHSIAWQGLEGHLYLCPRCGGGFSQWSQGIPEGTHVPESCPWCGLKRGEAPEVQK